MRQAEVLPDPRTPTIVEKLHVKARAILIFAAFTSRLVVGSLPSIPALRSIASCVMIGRLFLDP